MRESTKVVIFLVSLVVGIFSLIGLAFQSLANTDQKRIEEQKARVQGGYYMPSDATDIKDVGHGWQEFTYKGQRFLYRRAIFGHSGTEAIVKIDMPKPERF